MDFIPRQATVLDVGCGVGELLVLLDEEKGCRCFGVDISDIAIKRLQERGLEGRVSTLPAIPYADETFDVVTCTETLEHVDKPKRAVAEMTRVVRTGGSIILSVPDGTTDHEEVHLYRYTPVKLRRLLSGFLHVESIEVLADGEHTSLLARATKPLR
jgi:methionine biosynthesis protein MetW